MTQESTSSEFVVEAKRELDAPPAVAWRSWTDSALLRRWWGPTGFTCPTADLDVRVGGTSLVSMSAPELGPRRSDRWPVLSPISAASGMMASADSRKTGTAPAWSRPLAMAMGPHASSTHFQERASIARSLSRSQEWTRSRSKVRADSGSHLLSRGPAYSDCGRIPVVGK